MSTLLRRMCVGRRSGLVSACVALVAITHLMGAGKAPMRVLRYDPKAEKQAMFAGMESGALAVRVVAHDIKGGNLFIENLSGKPITVELPDALAMVHVLKQAGGNGFFGQLQNGNGAGALGQPGGQQGAQQGGGQSLGSGFGQQQGNTPGLGNANGNANGFNAIIGNGLFSIPPERTVQVPYQSVCLNYGKPDPSPRMTYKPVPLEEFTQDEVLQETLRAFGKGQIDHTAAQAAAWHQTDNLSWNALASLKEYTLPGVFSSQVPTFSTSQLQAAKDSVAAATRRVAERPKSKATTRVAATTRRSANAVVESKLK